jgi:ABC-type nitrate/sulfonate/bicarbonate transport system ATPase subunit
LSLDVTAGEFVSIVGPSGCGKSTLFSVLTGVERADAGEVLVDGRPAELGSPAFAWMPQRDCLLPWRRVDRNVSLGLEVDRVPRAEARRRAAELLSSFGLADFARSWPTQLSGGMRQRVALARTVAPGREVLLLDEPFGALDAFTRTELQLWLERIWELQRWTVLLITHDVREAVLLSDRVLVLGPRPTRVELEVPVPLPRPRSLETLTDPRAIDIERQLLSALHVGGPGRTATAP